MFLRLLHIPLVAVWPDLKKFRQSANILEVFGNFWRVYLIFVNMLNLLLWYSMLFAHFHSNKWENNMATLNFAIAQSSMAFYPKIPVPLSFTFKKNGPTPASFIVDFRSFQTNIIKKFTTKISEKCPSSIRCRDSNPWPPEHESPPITTRPGLPHNFSFTFLFIVTQRGRVRVREE